MKQFRPFLLRALTAMTVCYGAYYYPYPAGSLPAAWLDAYLQLVAQASGAIVSLLDPSVAVVGTTLQGRFALEIVKSCSSLDLQALGAAAVLAFPASAEVRVWGVTVIVLGVTVVNWLRIALLYVVGLHAPQRFDMLHEELLPLVMLALTVAAFWAWAYRATKQGGKLAAPIRALGEHA